MRRAVQACAWVYEFSGPDETWRLYRTTLVTTKRRRTYNAAKTTPTP